VDSGSGRVAVAVAVASGKKMFILFCHFVPIT
jgi:hypothetical protein